MLRDVAELSLVSVEVPVRVPSLPEVDPVSLVVPERPETVCVVLDSDLVPELELTVPVCVALD